MTPDGWAVSESTHFAGKMTNFAATFNKNTRFRGKWRKIIYVHIFGL